MKCFVLTMVLFGMSAFAFAQTTVAKPVADSKQSIPQKTGKTDSLTYRPEISVISIIPTLKLWLLPANIPNPFMKDDD